MIDVPIKPEDPSWGAKIAVRDLVKSFDGKVVLEHVTLQVHPGESLVVVGGSGSGKTVLLKHMIGLMRPDSGAVLIDGVDITQLEAAPALEVRRKFGMAFQEGALFDSLNVFENVAFPLRRQRKLKEPQIAARVRECLTLVHLEGIEQRQVNQLSGGMRRRVGFARAIAHAPQILLFDEPNTGLDPMTSASIDRVIIEMREQLAVTMVTITHDLRSAFRIADRIAMIREGRIIIDARPDEFRSSPDRYVQKFIAGEPIEEDVA